MTSISSKAMLVYMTITGWSGRAYDDKASDEVAKNHNTKKERAGNYNKNLIDQKSETWLAVKRSEDALRKYHYAHTLKWSINGAQMLTAAEWFEYAAEMQKLEREWRRAVKDFIEDYPRLKKNAEHELNGLYDEAQYPPARTLADKFEYRIDYFPLPAGEDMERLRDSLGVTAELEVMGANIDARVEAAIQEAMRDLGKRLLEPVQHMAATLSLPEKVFRDSLVSNVRDICELLPRLNVTGDEELERLCLEVEGKLGSHSPQALRTDADLRANVAKEANAIAKKMAAYMGSQA